MMIAADGLDSTFAALADPTRRGMLARLALGESTVGEFARPFETVADWAGAHNLSTRRILLGEFGVHRQMPALNLVAEPWSTASL